MEDKETKEELQSIKQTLTGVVIGLVFLSVMTILWMVN